MICIWCKKSIILFALYFISHWLNWQTNIFKFAIINTAADWSLNEEEWIFAFLKSIVNIYACFAELVIGNISQSGNIDLMLAFQADSQRHRLTIFRACLYVRLSRACCWQLRYPSPVHAHFRVLAATQKHDHSFGRW